MPNRDQKRTPRSQLKRVLSENLRARLGDHPDFKGLGKASGLGKNTIIRAYNAENAATIDTIEALAELLNVEPWVLLMRGGIGSVGKVFSRPVPDARLGNKWTRPDRPLLQSENVKSSTRPPKIKAK